MFKAPTVKQSEQLAEAKLSMGIADVLGDRPTQQDMVAHHSTVEQPKAVLSKGPIVTIGTNDLRVATCKSELRIDGTQNPFLAIFRGPQFMDNDCGKVYTDQLLARLEARLTAVF